MDSSETQKKGKHDTRAKEQVSVVAAAALSSGEHSMEAQREQWEKMLSVVIKAIVVIRVCTCRSFDTHKVSYSVATGFVVDAKRGLILTNRHVVETGPVRADAIFQNHEEVTLHPLYRDPVHDFGFYRFDPSTVKYMTVSEIALAPENARVGIQVRVVGNDAGEKLSILSGTLARLDRPAPAYGVGEYNDFNTFYFQAASGTSGGSSGSPVLNIAGEAIALNAGGKRGAASSYYYPLDRVARALRILQGGFENVVPRGTMQAVFKHKPYDEVRRLGLQDAYESRVRSEFPDGEGMLVVHQVVPKGPADGHFQPGDILCEVNGKLTTTFLELETVLDQSVGKEVSLTFQRGGVSFTQSILVQDLHSITPSSYIEVGGAVLHALSYQQARNFSLPVGSVYVALCGYMLNRASIPKRSVIVKLHNSETPDLETFLEVFLSLADRRNVAAQFFLLETPQELHTTTVSIDRHWHSCNRFARDDKTGLFLKSPLPPAPEEIPKPVPVHFGDFSVDNVDLKAAVSKLHRSLVMVSFDIPVCIDGIHASSFLGTGLVVDTKVGLVVVDRNTVPGRFGDVTITFASTAIIWGKVIYAHPVYNFSVVKYDPSLLLDSDVESATLSDKPLKSGDSCCCIGLSKPNFYSPTHQLVGCTTRVTKVQEHFVNHLCPPRFRPWNCDVIHIDNKIPNEGAVLSDSDGNVQAFWASFSDQNSDLKNVQYALGVPVSQIVPTVKALSAGEQPRYHSLDIEFWPVSLAFARDHGLPDEYLVKVSQASAFRQILAVKSIAAGSRSSEFFKEGDLLLEIDGEYRTNFVELEQAIAGRSSISVKLCRNSEILELSKVPVIELDTVGTDRLVHFAGAVFQMPHHAVAQKLNELPPAIYSSRWFFGSPAHKYGLRAALWVIAVNDQPVENLDSLLKVVSAIPDNTFIRIKTRNLSSKRESVLTLKTDYHYWPTWEIKMADTDVGWELVSVEATTPSELTSSPVPAAAASAVAGSTSSAAEKATEDSK